MSINDSSVQRSIDEIVYQIKLDKVIPIMGYDLLFNEFEEKTPDDFLKRLIKIHAKDDLRAFQTEGEKSGYELINAYYHSLPDTDTFKLKLSETIQAQRIDRKLITESYRKIVCIKHFKLFINATFANTVELAINAHRAAGRNEQEIKSSYNIYNYHPTEPTDLPEEAPQRNFKIDFNNPVIYNLFGTHDDERGDYVLTDADYIELIYDLILNRQEKFINLLSYLKGGYLLFLGCNFPDWFFRFFIRISVGDRLDNVSPIKRKSVIDSLADPSRSVFIGHYKIQTLDVDCNELVDEIYRKLQNENGAPGLLGDRGNNNVFISYCREDEQVALDIAAQFDKKYIDYFLDRNDLREGNNLNDKITGAIDRCSLFLPVVSKNIGRSSPYIWMEWKYAIDSRKEIMPVYKDFVNPDMLLPEEYGVTAELKNKILNKNTTLGIVPGENNTLTKANLTEIKRIQYLSRVSGKKQIIKD